MTDRHPHDLVELAAAPRQSERCFSDLELDRLVASRERSAREAGHLASCERCRARLATFQASAAQSGLLVNRLLAEAKAEREVSAPVPLAPREVVRPEVANGRASPWMAQRAPRFAAAALLATAVGGLAIALLPEPSPTSTRATGVQDDVRTKGAALNMYLRRDGRVSRARSGDRFHEGDQLRFVVHAPVFEGQGWFLMLGVEPGGKVMTYYPFGGERSMAIGPGASVELPGSLVLDGALGDELLLSVFSSKPLAVTDVVDALEERGPPYSLDRLLDLDLDGQVHWTVLNKTPGEPGHLDEGTVLPHTAAENE